MDQVGLNPLDDFTQTHDQTGHIPPAEQSLPAGPLDLLNI
jgi:hypothetical protein